MAGKGDGAFIGNEQRQWRKVVAAIGAIGYGAFAYANLKHSSPNSDVMDIALGLAVTDLALCWGLNGECLSRPPELHALMAGYKIRERNLLVSAETADRSTVARRRRVLGVLAAVTRGFLVPNFHL